MSDANVVGLQTAINRFAKPAGFSKVKVDGKVGNETLTGARRALDFLSIDTDNSPASQLMTNQAAAFTATTAANTTTLATNAAALAGWLNHYANQFGYPVVAPPNVSVPAYVAAGTTAVEAAFPLSPTQGSSWTTSITTKWKLLPPWQKVSIGVLFGIGLMFAYKQIKQRRALTA